ncbi:ATP-binding protein [Conexibacter sp. CPCC 206217]|uniref:ATP-binding protein n=1 Tax=Conexibacter sp. CPCC 206217 TaxID=3064574 RepID=UPI00271990BD|nr:ATP-binding protein [Conexibacter sp. CPCC 206217]MDO8210500.1 ATP-binding protein [Conexibacter sp. CPCC 206217]
MQADASFSLQMPHDRHSYRSTRGPAHSASVDVTPPGGIEITLAASSDAPHFARRAVTDALAQWSANRRDAALLVISELVTNAIRHGAAGREDRISLQLRRRASTLRIEVTDPRARAGTIAEASLGGDEKRSGWGLPIIAELTDRWGVEHGPGRTCVWCELDGA